MVSIKENHKRCIVLFLLYITETKLTSFLLSFFRACFPSISFFINQPPNCNQPISLLIIPRKRLRRINQQRRKKQNTVKSSHHIKRRATRHRIEQVAT